MRRQMIATSGGLCSLAVQLLEVSLAVSAACAFATLTFAISEKFKVLCNGAYMDKYTFNVQNVNRRILSVELGVKGARHFVATTYDEFWARYRSLDSAARHHYEIIREGQPCNLYFGASFFPFTIEI